MMLQICEWSPAAWYVQPGAANTNARFQNFVKWSCDKKSAWYEDRRARLGWRDEHGVTSEET